MFGRATIRLGIGPHSSHFFLWVLVPRLPRCEGVLLLFPFHTYPFLPRIGLSNPSRKSGKRYKRPPRGLKLPVKTHSVCFQLNKAYC